MLISIIVPALNEEERIGGTLRALQELPGEKEIILVDGGSTDRTVELARAESVRVIKAQKGRGHQMHAGALAAAGQVLWFVHADTVPPPNALEEIASAVECGADSQSAASRLFGTHAVAGGNFGLVFDGDSRAARQLTAIYPFLRFLGLCYGDSGIFIRREVYDRIGGFRPLALFEDLDLLRRLRSQGRFVHLSCRMVTSSRRFEQRNFAVMWLHWTALQILYWCGVPPNWLARWYGRKV